LVAEKGRLKQVVEREGTVPNGTAFAIAVAPALELDDINLVVGRFVQGMGVLRELSELPVVKDGSHNPFFKAGKLVGDTRADVAELGFNRPLKRVTVAASGLL
jgi:hypothetical protein